jgi:hypothetical protein
MPPVSARLGGMENDLEEADSDFYPAISRSGFSFSNSRRGGIVDGELEKKKPLDEALP